MRLLSILALFLVFTAGRAAAQIHLSVADEITIFGYGLDSAGIQRTPDSVRVVVIRDGTEEHDAWYQAGDPQCAALNGGLAFFDRFGDVDDDAGEGLYEVSAGFFLDADSLYCWKTLWVYLGVGGGPYAVTLVAVDTAAMQTVPGASVAVRNLAQSSLIAIGCADASGEVTFNLDADSFAVLATAPGYVFAAPETLVVSGAKTDSLPGRHFDPGTPSAPGLCRVHGFVYTVAGEPEPGAAVSAWLPKGATRTGAVLVSPAAVSIATDSAGYFFLDLIPSDSLEGNPEYEITINRADGTILRKRVGVPATSSWSMTW